MLVELLQDGHKTPRCVAQIASMHAKEEGLTEFSILEHDMVQRTKDRISPIVSSRKLSISGSGAGRSTVSV